MTDAQMMHFNDAYCVARGIAVCSNVAEDRDAVAALFGGTQQVRIDQFTTVETTSQALYRALVVCQHFGSGALSPMQHMLLDAVARVVEYSTEGPVTQWCGEYLVARVRSDSATAQAAARADAAPSQVFGKLVCSAGPMQKARVASVVASVVLAWLAALLTLAIVVW